MKFLNSDRFAPVVNYEDQPWIDDYFHLNPEEITKDFLLKGLYDIDEEWWHKQDQRCRNGYTVENCIDYGGDVYVDEIDAFWNDSLVNDRYVKSIDYIIPPNSCYIPMYDLLILNRTLTISGRHYFYLNFGKIYALDNSKNKKDITSEYEDIKGLNAPIFTDVDWGFFTRINNMFRFKKDTSEAKTRQLGYSQKSGIGLLAYNFTFIPHSVSIVAGGMSDDADNTFAICREFTENIKNTQFYKAKKRGGDRDGFIQGLNSGSKVYSISCKDNTQALSRLTPFMTILEEEGKWRKGLVSDVVQFNKAAQKAQGKKTGFNVHIGTGGDMELGAADLEDMHYHPVENGLLSYRNKWERDDTCIEGLSGHFTPGWQFKIIDKDGNSLKAPSVKFLEDELALIPTRETKKRYIYTTQHALYAADAFMISSGGFFGENIVRMVNERKAYIVTHVSEQVEKVGRLEWKDPKHPLMGCRFENDENGSIHIFEEPEIDSNGIPFINLYKAGTDSYDQDESQTSLSKGDIRILKGFLNANTSYHKFVAKCTDRPATAQGGKDIWYENTAKLCVYYNANNLVEFSKILIIEWYITHNFESLLKERPGLAIASFINKSKSVNRYGIDTSTKLHWLTKYRKFLEIPENIESMDDVEQLTSIAKFRLDPKYNCDTTIASSLAIVCLEDDIEMEVRDSGNTKPEDKLRKFKRVGDKLIEVFE